MFGNMIVVIAIGTVLLVFYILIKAMFSGSESQSENYHYSAPKTSQKGSLSKSIYSIPTIREFEIVGIYYGDWNKTGWNFSGFARPDEYNDHDKYAVEVLHRSGSHVGWIPKGSNRKLFRTLIEINEDESPLLFDVSYNSERDYWNGVCTIFIGFDNQVFKEFEKLVRTTSEYNSLKSDPDGIDDEGMFMLMNHDRRCGEFLKTNPIFKEVDYKFRYTIPSSLLTKKIKSLYDSNDWESLSKYDEYKDLIVETLHERYAKTAIKRIEDAVNNKREA